MDKNLRLPWPGRSVSAAFLLLFSILIGAGSAGARQGPASTPTGITRGQAAIATLGDRLPGVAAEYGLSEVELGRLFLNDHTLHVGRTGELFYVEDNFPGDTLASSVDGAAPAAAPFPESATFTLHSRPGADHTIYLDFDGHVTSGTSWNSNYGVTTINSPAYDIDGDYASFSAAEHERMQLVWQIVAEDYRPFEVDVTTQDPGPAALSYSGGGDRQWGTRVVVTEDTFANCGCGGHAFIGSFDDSMDEPVFVYNSSLKGVSEASSHEVGHALLLAHDGLASGTTYYQGHGSGETGWAPLMGASYYVNISHWSKGEYFDSNNNNTSANYSNGPDDLAIIASLNNGNGFGYRPDDHGDNDGSASDLGVTAGVVEDSGLIERTSDVDVFSFEAGAGPISLSITPFSPGPNLDVLAALYDSGGSLVVSDNPPGQLGAAINTTVNGGTYYLHIDGTGAGNPLSSPPTGYTDYGSLGQYAISGSLVDPGIPGLTTLAIIGDFGDASSAEGSVATLVNGWNPDFIITTGDNRYGTTTFDQTVGQYYCGHLAGAGIGTICAGGTAGTNAFFPATGNHDYSDGSGIAEYLAYFTLPGAGVTGSDTSGNERYYDFIQGDLHFFVLDSQGALNSAADMTAQQNWLQSQLASSTAAWQVVYLHHAPFSSSSNHGSTAAFQWPYAAWGADAVIAGHDHSYERISRDGIVYFVNGLGGRSLYAMGTPVSGSQVRYNSDYGAMLVQASAASVNFQFINSSATVIDDFTLLPSAGGIVDVQITQSADDVEERALDGGMDMTSTDIELGDDPGLNADQTVGLRFQNVSIPQGATVTAAYLEFETDELDSELTEVTIWAQDADDAPAFTTEVNNVTNRAKSSASTSWNIPAWNTVDEKHQSPTIINLVQELVSRANWVSGNSLAFIISGTGSRTAESFDGEPAAAALLHVEYTEGGGNIPPAFIEDPLVKSDATEDAAYSATLDGDAGDLDGDSLTFSKVSGPAWLTVAADGALSGTPLNDDVGLNSWIVKVEDGNGGSDQATLEITVLNTNDPPAFTADPVVESDATEDAAFSGTLDGDAGDLDGDSLTFSKVSGPAWLTVAAGGALSGTPLNSDVGLNSWIVKVEDGNGGSDQATLEITVLNTNDPPAFTADPVVESDASEDAAYSGTLDGDAGDLDDDNLTYSKVSGPAWLTIAANGALSGTPLNSDVGLNSWSVQVEDGNGGSDQATLEITVINTNDPPTFNSDPIVEANGTEGVVYSGTLADDAVDDDGDSLIFSKVNGPTWLAIAADGTLSGTPGGAATGLNSFAIHVTDGHGGVGSTTLEITVEAMPLFVDQTAESEIFIAGTVAGVLEDTQANDGATEWITERESGGRRNSRFSFMEHKWLFNVQPGDTVTLHVNAWAAASTDGDNFVLSYSIVDLDSLYVQLAVITAKSDEAEDQTFVLPPDLSGMVYIRLEDTDRNRGNKSLDTVFIDHLFIRSDTALPSGPPSAPATLVATAAGASQINLSWNDTSNNESSFVIESSADGLGGWSEIAQVGPDVTGYSDRGLAAETTYYYRVAATNAVDTSAYSNLTRDTTGEANGLTMTVSTLGESGNPGNRSIRWSATVTITIVDQAGLPLSGATVIGTWSGGATGYVSCSPATNAAGECSITRNNIKISESSVIFTVDDVQHTTHGHTPGPITSVEVFRP